jgi:hypothetical protein
LNPNADQGPIFRAFFSAEKNVRKYFKSKFDDAVRLRRLCRITAKRMDDHNFVPLLEVGKRPEAVKCHVTGMASRGGAEHHSRDDYKYVTPVLKKEAMDKTDLVRDYFFTTFFG